jgi:hypothetical protein
MSVKQSIFGLVRSLAAVALLTGLLTACGEIVSRDDFVNFTKDKTSDEVASKFGKPATTDESDPSRVIWTYHNVTFEAGASSKRDTKTTVTFKREASGKLRVAEVKFQ